MVESITSANLRQHAQSWVNAHHSRRAIDPVDAYIVGHESRDADFDALRVARDAEQADADRLTDALTTLLHLDELSGTNGVCGDRYDAATLKAKEALDARRKRIEAEAASGGG